MLSKQLHCGTQPPSYTSLNQLVSSRPVPVLRHATPTVPQHGQPSSASPTPLRTAHCSFTQRNVVVFGQASEVLKLPIDRDLDQPLAGFDSIESALQDLAAGKFVVALDDEDRENEGDLIINGDKMTTESMHFMVEHTSGVICIAMEGHDLDRLKLPLMVSSLENEESMYTAFTVTVDLRDGISTGISASDRTKTILRMSDPTATAQQFRRPGHIFPLKYRPGGVLVRPGHTEASVDLARLSGSFSAGVLCEIVNKEDGSMARTPQLLKFAKQHGLKCITIADLIRYRLKHEQLVTATGAAQLGSRHGPLTVHSFKAATDGAEHLAITSGNVSGQSEVPLYIHYERTVADLLGATAGTSSTLERALSTISQEGKGVVLYVRGQSGKGIQPSEELAAAAVGTSASLYKTDLRDVGACMQMLRSLGVQSVQMIAGDAAQVQALTSCGVVVAGNLQSPAKSNGVHAKELQLNGAR